LLTIPELKETHDRLHESGLGSSVLGYDKLQMIRQHIAAMEGPKFIYEPIFADKLKITVNPFKVYNMKMMALVPSNVKDFRSKY
jgi:hypothetical protein